MNVSVVICTKDRPVEFKETLKTILKQTYKPHEIIVVDGSNSGETKKFAKNIKLSI